MVVSTFRRSTLQHRKSLGARALSALSLSSLVGFSLLGGGCLDRELKPLNPCLVSGVVDRISVENVDKVDLLFVVDNSGSMREEQQALRVQFPRIITTLTTGVRGDGSTFPAVRDLHLGVVSTDMGLPGVPLRSQLKCGDDQSRPFGDDGVLQNRPNPAGASGITCQDSYPQAFLSFQLDVTNATQIANDFSCIASLGTDGCGFEMQLEAALRALWPSNNMLPNGMQGQFADNKPFADMTMNGKGEPGGPNTGFLRNDPTRGQSLIAVIVVSDEEDCSSFNMGHFTPNEALPDGEPLKNVALNLRCFNESRRVGGEAARDNGAGNLYSTSRYAQGLKALRPGKENLVVFAAIVGVPSNLVDPTQVSLPDFTDPVARDAYYDFLLSPSVDALVEKEDPSLMGTGQANLVPSCIRPVIDPATGQEALDPVTGQPVPKQKAFPPRRFIKVAKEFGENATIQSICSDDFTPAVNQIIDIIARQLGAVCLPRQLIADAEGKVNCDVIWELPAPGTAEPSIPTNCGQFPEVLDFPAAGRPQTSDTGRALCVVKQVPVVSCAPVEANCIDGQKANSNPTNAQGEPLATSGWYYDDFSPEVDSCTGLSQQRVAFTNNNNINAQPPSGVTVRLECLQEAASVIVPRNDVELNVPTPPPSIGSPCDNDVQCQVKLAPFVNNQPINCAAKYRLSDASGCYDTQMFCHPQQKVCVVACDNKSECLPGFECDTRLESIDPALGGAGRPFCLNPTCGE